MDFLKIRERPTKKGGPIDIYPTFSTKTSKDLMTKGGAFYAIWDDRIGKWSTKQDDVIDLIDRELDKYKKSDPKYENAVVSYMEDSDSGSIDKWKKYIEKQVDKNSYHQLDQTITFLNTPVNREDYSSKCVPYELAPGDYSAWDEMLSVLYSPAERHKIEWAIGSIVTGASKSIQKFFVFYGSHGTGKSTVLNVIIELFKGYYTTFDAKSIGRYNAEFALEPFKNFPLVAIQHDGDLSRIEDNTRLNSLVSHEEMLTNEKFLSQYTLKPQAMIFMATNKPVKITDSRSGIIRRLVDISPTGKLIPRKRFEQLKRDIDYELGAIAWHCKEVFEEDPGYYDNYVPKMMMGATNDFFNFMEENYDKYKKDDFTTLNESWLRYKIYCDDAKVPYPYTKRVFKEELKNYFRQFRERFHAESDVWYYNWYGGFKIEMFSDGDIQEEITPETEESWLRFETTESIFDKIASDYPAQLTTEEGTPRMSWDKVETVLADIDTRLLHYVRVPLNHIVIDFDLKDENGNKSLEKNLKAASKFPKTYAELSKSGQGIHLHYIYNGDVAKLARLYAEDIEVKVFTGKMSLRRMLTRCNDIPIATITSGLPLKGEVKLVEKQTINDAIHLRNLIEKALRKEIEPYATKTSIDFIDHILKEAYSSGITYDVSDLEPKIMAFAASSSNHAMYCMDVADQMLYKSETEPVFIDAEDDTLVFFDVEVFPNLFIVVVKPEEKSPYYYINPDPTVIENLCKFNLVGFNNLRYDNLIFYARLLGKDEYGLFLVSQSIINEGKENSVGEEFLRSLRNSSRNLSYTDVYDFSSEKKSLKKWEIELGEHHQELGFQWDKPVPEENWKMVAEYCINDVVATEAVFKARAADFKGRLILVDLANTVAGPGSCPNDTTNTLTAKIITRNIKNPQDHYIYPDLSKRFVGYEYNRYGIDKSRYISPDVIISGKSIYKGYDPGEGGFVFARPGMYENVWCFDSASHHPSSLIAENGFGDLTDNFAELLDIRLHIKHKDYDYVRTMHDGLFAKYLETDEDAKALSYALKIAINSVYGLTAAHFDNRLRDPRNVDNWVAKRGALFMIDLMLEVEKLGYNVVHIKTDSIKVENADERCWQFIYDFGKKYGYTFEIEHIFEKICLVNDAVYVCKYSDAPENGKMAGQWDATGAQFKEPYVFKTLFSGEPIEFKDLCVTQTTSVGLGLYLDTNENLADVSSEEKELNRLISKWKKRGFELSDANEQILIEDEKATAATYGLDPQQYHMDYIRMNDLVNIIKMGHDYGFVGKAGLFCPVVPGAGGGLLVRENNGKFASAGGAKNYRWLEAETVQKNGKESEIDISYFEDLVDKAKAAINNFGDFNMFAEQ